MSDKVVIITGAGRGIGLACARRFLNDGYQVMLADRDPELLDNAIEELGGEGETLEGHTADISDRLAVHNLVAETLAKFGRIDVLINNAGIVARGGILDTSEADFDNVLGVNLRGAFLLSKAVAKHMVEELNAREDRSGLNLPEFSIINVSSINAQVTIADNLAYSVSKGGLNQLTKSMAIELAPHGIRVNAIGPGSVKTDMLSSVLGNSEAMDTIYSRTPLGRLARPSEIASVAAFLASADASYITGECIYVDGGRLALNYIMAPRDEDSEE